MIYYIKSHDTPVRTSVYKFMSIHPVVIYCTHFTFPTVKKAYIIIIVIWTPGLKCPFECYLHQPGFFFFLAVSQQLVLLIDVFLIEAQLSNTEE